VDKYKLGTYKINRWGKVGTLMTICQDEKKGGYVDNFIGKYLVLSVCQGTRWIGDNPPHTF